MEGSTSTPRGIAALLAAGILAASAAEARGNGEYAISFASGRRISSDDLAGWPGKRAQPTVEGVRLFDDADPARWILQCALEPSGPRGAFVELRNGDVLPGRVIAYRDGCEPRFRRVRPYLLVEPDVAVDWPDGLASSAVAVLAEWARRIVWEPRGGPYRPGSLFLRDGRELSFRSLRWSGRSVLVLLDSGTGEFPFSLVAEAHLPPGDPWDSYYEEVAALSPDLSSRLVTVETTDGLRITSCLERHEVRARGNEKDTRGWFHGLQAAWSTREIWIPHPRIRAWRFFPPQEPPLSALDPSRFERAPMLGGGWGLGRDASVRGHTLRAGGMVQGWGLGMQAPAETEYRLSPEVRAFRTRVGLDASAGRGGCARARVALSGATTIRLFESPTLVGSEVVLDTGWIDVADAARRRAGLVLVADAAHEDRPPGADPFDIRDALDWIEPELRLDRAALRIEVGGRARRWFPAWEGWSLAGAETVPFEVANRWNGPLSAWGDEVLPSLPFLQLSRTVGTDTRTRRLLLAVSRDREDGASRIRVSLDGRPLGDREVPVRGDRDEPDPMVFELPPEGRREMALDIFQIPRGADAWVSWSEIAFIETPPGLARLFEDDLPAVPSGASLVAEDRHRGKACLRIDPTGFAVEILSGLQHAVREHPRAGEFRYLRLAWKSEGAARMAIEIARDGGFDARRILRYEAGTGEPPRRGSVRLAEKPPDKWTEVTRDLYADFGDFTLTGMAVLAEGGAACVDHAYLGRSLADLEALDKEAAGTH